MANITHPHQETSHSVLNAYEQFAQDDLHQGKIVARVNEHKIQIAKMGPQDHPPTYIAKNGTSFPFPEQERRAVIEHFKKALKLKYGNITELLFSSAQQEEALQRGLSHNMIRAVLEKARPYALQHDADSLIPTMHQAQQHLNKLEKNDPLFQRCTALDQAKAYVKKATRVLTELNHDSTEQNSHLLNQLNQEIMQLNLAITRVESLSGDSPTAAFAGPPSSTTPANRLLSNSGDQPLETPVEAYLKEANAEVFALFNPRRTGRPQDRPQDRPQGRPQGRLNLSRF